MSLLIKSFARTVTTAGTAVPLSTTPIYTTAFMIRANRLNAGYIYVGDSTVNSTNSPELEPREANSKSAQAVSRGKLELFDLSKIYINASVSGDGVKVEYMVST